MTRGDDFFSGLRKLEFFRQQRAGGEWVGVLAEMRAGLHISPATLKHLRPLAPSDLANDPLWQFAPVAVENNYERAAISYDQAIRFARARGVPVLAWHNPIVKASGFSQPLSEADHRYLWDTDRRFVSLFVPGAPCYITNNQGQFANKKGAVNGAAVTMHSVTFGDDVDPSVVQDIKDLLADAEPGEVVLIDKVPQSVNVILRERSPFRDEEVLGRIVRDEVNAAGAAEVARFVIIPILSSTDFDEKVACLAGPGRLLKGVCKLKAFNVDLGFSVTFCKLQGRTVQRLLVNFIPSPGSRIDFSDVYVALSRVRAAEHVRLLPMPASNASLSHLELAADAKVCAWMGGYDAAGMWVGAARRVAKVAAVKAKNPLAAAAPAAPRPAAPPPPPLPPAPSVDDVCQLFGITAARIPRLRGAFAALNPRALGAGSVAGAVDCEVLNFAFRRLAQLHADYCPLLIEHIEALVTDGVSAEELGQSLTAQLQGAHTQKRFIVSAIHLYNHWALVLADRHARTIFIRDSIGGDNARGVKHTRVAASLNFWLRRELGAAFGGADYTVDRDHGGDGIAGLPLQFEGNSPDGIACGAYAFCYALWHARSGGAFPTRADFHGAPPRTGLRLVLLNALMPAPPAAAMAVDEAADDDVVIVVEDVARAALGADASRIRVGSLMALRRRMQSNKDLVRLPRPRDLDERQGGKRGRGGDGGQQGRGGSKKQRK